VYVTCYCGQRRRSAAPSAAPSSQSSMDTLYVSSETDSASSDCCFCDAYKRSYLLTLSSPLQSYKLVAMASSHNVEAINDDDDDDDDVSCTHVFHVFLVWTVYML